MANPKVGARVRLHYVKARRAYFAYHGRAGSVVIAGRGRPRNHLIQLDGGPVVVVPCGNLMPEPPVPRLAGRPPESGRG